MTWSKVSSAHLPDICPNRTNNVRNDLVFHKIIQLHRFLIKNFPWVQRGY